MPGKRTDPDQIASYCAEGALRAKLDMSAGRPLEVFGTTVTVPVERKFGALEHIQVYVDWVLRQPFTKALWPKAAAKPVRVRKRASNGTEAAASKAHYEHRSREGDSCIAIHDPKLGMVGFAMREVVVLHELAHHVTRCEYGTGGHGIEWRRAYIELVGEFIGSEAAWLLQIEFMEQNLTVA